MPKYYYDFFLLNIATIALLELYHILNYITAIILVISFKGLMERYFGLTRSDEFRDAPLPDEIWSLDSTLLDKIKEDTVRYKS